MIPRPQKTIDFSVLDQFFSGRLSLKSKSTGEEVGDVLLSIVNEDELADWQRSWWRDYPELNNFPIGDIQKIFVKSNYRKMGFGKAGLSLVDEFFMRNNVMLAVMNVTCSPPIDENPIHQIDWRVTFYQRCGWTLFGNKEDKIVKMVKYYK